MARYRAGIDLALPLFDTYGCLEKFARRPGDRAARMAYWRLRKRARNELLYDALARVHRSAPARALIGLRSGISLDELSAYMLAEDDEPAGRYDLNALDDAGRARLFADLCRIHGVAIDRSDSMSASESVGR